MIHGTKIVKCSPRFYRQIYTIPNHLITQKVHKSSNINVYENNPSCENYFKFDQDSVFLPQLDGASDFLFEDNTSFELKFSSLEHDDFFIPQLDGSINLDAIEYSKPFKTIYAVNCEIIEVSILINFFRSAHPLWEALKEHELCIFDKKNTQLGCFICHFRSSCLRLNVERKRGPKSLRPYEFICQLDKYNRMNWNWTLQKKDMICFLKKTLELIKICGEIQYPIFNDLHGKCTECNREFRLENNGFHELNKDRVMKSELNCISMRDALISLCLPVFNKCCMNSYKFIHDQKRYLVIKFAPSIDIEIVQKDSLWGKSIKYISHICNETNEEFELCKSFFQYNDIVVYQNESEDIIQSVYKIHTDVKILTIMLDDFDEFLNLDPNIFIYKQDILKRLSKEYLSWLAPDKFNAKKIVQKEKDRLRDQSESRRNMHKLMDATRDKTPKRKLMH